MRKSHSTKATLIVIVLLLIINVVVFNWTSKFFRSRYAVGLLQYGHLMPSVEGRGYSGEQIVSISGSKPMLVIYLTPAGLKGQTIALLKFCETLSQQDPSLFQATFITAGRLPELQQ